MAHCDHVSSIVQPKSLPNAPLAATKSLQWHIALYTNWALEFVNQHSAR